MTEKHHPKYFTIPSLKECGCDRCKEMLDVIFNPTEERVRNLKQKEAEAACDRAWESNRRRFN